MNPRYCACPEGPYIGTQRFGDPIRCERCGHLTPERGEGRQVDLENNCPMTADGRHVDPTLDPDWNEVICSACDEVCDEGVGA